MGNAGLDRDVSVIIPARNAADTLRKAIESVIDQDGLLEIIVVDDASEDNTYDLCRELQHDRLKVIRTTGVGIAGALNAGFQEARGSFIARCDADDLYVTGRLKWQHDLLAQSPDHVAVSSGFRTITEPESPLPTSHATVPGGM